MKTVLAILQALVGAAVQLGLAYRAGANAARDQQRQTDLETAANADAVKEAGLTASRDDLVDKLQQSGRLRD